MPIYEYKCNNCGKVSEYLEGVGIDKPDIVCKHCGSRELSKVFSRSFISVGGNPVTSSGRRTCCGRSEPCEKPPCFDDGVCKR